MMKLWYKSIFLLVVCALSSLPVQARKIDLSAELGTPVIEAGSKQNTFLKIALTGFELDESVERTPANIAIVLDESGSMTGEKLEQAKEAALLAVKILNKDDILSVVSYDSAADVLMPATRLNNKAKVRKAIKAMEAGGSTALFAGVSKGAKEVRKFFDKQRVNRVILLSDGQANVGPSTPTELGELGTSLGKEGISVTTIGLGEGYNEDLMTNLAGYSDGNHAFVEDAHDLVKIFKYEFGDVLSVVAQDLTIKIELGDGIKPLRILGRSGEIIGRKVKTNLNQLYSDQEKYILIEVEVPEGKADESRDLASVSVSYQNMESKRKDTVHDQVRIKYSSSKKEVKNALNHGVVKTATKQLANEMSKEALKLRDQGKREEARRVLREGAASFRDIGRSLGGDAEQELNELSNEVDREAKAIFEDKDWNRNRKLMKSKQYKRDNQQSY